MNLNLTQKMKKTTKKKLKRSDGVQTKAYKEPKKKSEQKPKAPPKPKPKPAPKLQQSQPVLEFGRRLTTRTSTALKTSETIKILKQRDAESRRRKLKLKKKKVERKLTQEEILEEAKLTEKMNLESLKKYEEMELEARRKAVRAGAKTVEGPAIRYHSVAMPLIEEIKKEENLANDVKTETPEEAPHTDGEEKVDENENKKHVKERQSRTFLSFTDEETMKQSFPHADYRVPASKICAVTRLPAKYFDPVTELHYANLQAFKIIREAYYQQLESKGDKSDPEIGAWLDWREKNKPNKQILINVNRPPSAFINQSAAATPRMPSVSGVQQQPPPVSAAVTKPSVTVPSQVVTTTKQQVVLPTRPLPVVTSPPVTTTVQTLRLPASSAPTQQVVSANQQVGGRTIATTTLTAAQLQQLAAARGQVFVSALQTQIRAGTAQVVQAGVGRGGVRGQLVRGQTSLIVSQQL